MGFTQAYAHEVAQRFFRTRSALKRLGGGVSGFVFLSPDLRTAAKVHHGEEGYTTELYVYKQLARLGIRSIRGLTIPRMRGYSTALRIIQMDVVRPPFLLDFAGVLLNPPDFSDDVQEDWHRRIAERFGPNASVAYEVYDALAKHELYYVDFRVSNLNLTGLSGLLSAEENGEDDD
jgi:hypothetical protein